MRSCSCCQRRGCSPRAARVRADVAGDFVRRSLRQPRVVTESGGGDCCAKSAPSRSPTRFYASNNALGSVISPFGSGAGSQPFCWESRNPPTQKRSLSHVRSSRHARTRLVGVAVRLASAVDGVHGCCCCGGARLGGPVEGVRSGDGGQPRLAAADGSPRGGEPRKGGHQGAHARQASPSGHPRPPWVPPFLRAACAALSATRPPLASPARGPRPVSFTARSMRPGSLGDRERGRSRRDLRRRRRCSRCTAASRRGARLCHGTGRSRSTRCRRGRTSWRCLWRVRQLAPAQTSLSPQRSPPPLSPPLPPPPQPSRRRRLLPHG